jgi:hypothetical protein
MLALNKKNMKEVVEIVFEKVRLENTVDLLARIMSCSTLKDYHISTDTPTIKLDLLSKEELVGVITHSSEGSFYFNFLNLNTAGILLTELGVQIYKYGDDYDLNLHIDEKEISQKTSISNLQNLSESFANELKAITYFCGLEPAIDEETRFFSKSNLGPLKNWTNIGTH